MKITIPLNLFRSRTILFLLPLALLQVLVWTQQGQILDGRMIAVVLSIVTGLNLVLALVLFRRLQPFSMVALLATYILYVFYLVLLAAELRVGRGI